MVTQEFAKLPCSGSNPLRASKYRLQFLGQNSHPSVRVRSAPQTKTNSFKIRPHFGILILSFEGRNTLLYYFMVRNREKEPIPLEKKEEVVLNGGYSEIQQAQDIESKSGDLTFQKRSRGMQSVKDSTKTLDVYRDVTKELDKLVESYIMLLEKDLHQAQKMLTDIEKMRKVQKDLLDKLFGSEGR